MPQLFKTQPKSKQLKNILATLIALSLLLLGGSLVYAHNLGTRMVYMFFDPDTQAMLDARINDPSWTPPQSLFRVGDEIGVIIKIVPTDGTTTGVGGYIDFYVPNGVTVLDTAYVMPDGSGGFEQVPMRGQAYMPSIGAGGDPVIDLTGLTRGPNILGVTSPLVTTGNSNLGTLPGVYGDTGIFYATDPNTAYGTWDSQDGGGTITNNRGLTFSPFNRWDAMQMAAFGISSSTNLNYSGGPIIDSNGRGNTAWGLANAVAGPESGYAWQFDKDAWDATGSIDDALTLGPWQRIQYPGSRIANDPPGNFAAAPRSTGLDGSTVGYDLNPGNPLPATVSQTDNTSPKTIRWSIGQLTLYQPEYAWVKFRIDNLAAIIQPNGCPVFHADTFGGDAGGDSGGKDHLWRYYNPTEINWDACLAIGKQADRELVKVGDNLQYKINFYNATARNLTNVVIEDILPGGVSFISAVPAQSSGPNPLRWTIGNVLAGEKVEITVNVKVSGSGRLENIVKVSGQTPDSDPIAAQSTEVTVAGSIPLLSANKSVGPASIAPGGLVQYTIQIKNVGSGASGSPLVIDEFLPTGFNYVSKDRVLLNGADVTGATTVNLSNLNQPKLTVPGAINPGGELLLTFTAQTNASINPGPYCNTYSYTHGSLRQSTGALACVTVGGGVIGDTIFRDWNGNGLQDAEDEGIAGVTVQLSSGQTATTDANGHYVFNGLVAGSYTVTVTDSGGQLSGYSLTTGNEPATVTLTDEEQRLDVDFGYQPGGSGSIGDMVFEDTGNDGSYDPGQGDSGIANVTVSLYEDTNGNGQIDAEDALVGTTSSGSDGSYSFSGLAEGLSYLVDVDELDSDLSAYFGGAPTLQTTADLHPVSSLNGSDPTAVFGFYEIVPGSIGDQVFADNNSNGSYDAGDEPLAFVTVKLYQDINGDGQLNAGDRLLKSSETDVSGSYSFTDLGPGSYLVKVDQTDTDLPGGYVTASGDIAVTLAAAENNSNIDFPFVELISKAVSAGSANPGDTLTYTITANYPGPDPLDTLVVTDSIPAGTSYVANSANAGGIYDSLSNIVQWELGSNSAATPGLTAQAGSALCPAVVDLTPTKDTYLSENNPTNNYGGNTLLLTKPKAGDLKYALLQFDLSSIPAGSIVQGATLQMNVQSNRSSHYDQIYRMLTPWTEGTQTANTCSTGASWNAPSCTGSWAGGSAFGSSDYASPRLGTLTPSSKGYKSASVLPAVEAWVNQGVANNGFVLISTGTDGGDAKYYNRENTTASTDPTLRVVYLKETVGGCAGPTTLTAIADTYLDKNSPTTNNGAATTMRTRPDSQTRHSLIRFDLATIPPDAEITSAILSLNVNNSRSSNHVDTLHRLLTAWTEGSATWNTRNESAGWAAGAFSSSDYASTSLGSITPSSTGLKTVDIASLVKDWVNNGAANNGLLLLSTGTDNGDAQYSTREDGTDSKRPELTITWTLPPNPAAQTRVDLSAEPMLIANSAGQIRVTMRVTASQSISNVTPPVNLNISTAGGVLASKLSGPTPKGPITISPDSPTTFSYVYNITPGAAPGEVTLSGKPAAAGGAFATATSNSVPVSPPLTFEVTVDDPAGVGVVENIAYLQDSGLIPTTASQPARTALSASIGDTIWADLDGDGLQDAGEPGLSGVEVTITAADGSSFTATTDLTGHYTIYGLSSGSYTVTYNLASVPAGYQPTTPASLQVTLTKDSEQYLDADFGLEPPGTASIGDIVWLDADEDDLLDAGESGLPGVTVNLYMDNNGNGLIDAGDVLFATTTTVADGSYLFDGLNGGRYLVQVDETSTVTSTLDANVTATIAGAMELVSGSNPLSITLTSDSEQYLDADFGYNWRGSIGDYTWYDDNGDTVQDTGEKAAGGVTVILYYDANNNGKIDITEPLFQITETAAGGSYLFDNLPPGVYLVKGDESTVDSPTTPGLYGTMVPTTDETLVVTLTAGSSMTVTDADFGFLEASIIEGHVFHDLDNNGVLSGGEPRLEPVTVTITGTDIAGNSVSLTTTTDDEGEYKFIVPPGDYTITYSSADVEGIDPGLTEATTVTSYTFNLGSGLELAGFDFGIDHSGTIGDTVYNDANGNGSQGTDESGLAGVTVGLYDSSGTTLLAVQATDASGNYLFEGLADGDYVVRVDFGTVPADYSQTADPDADLNNEGAATVSGGGSDLSMDFGYQIQLQTYTISGTIFADENGNGSDDSEPALAGVKVTVTCNTGSFVTTADSNGDWSVSGVVENSSCTTDANESNLPNRAYVATTPATLTVTALSGDVTGQDFGYQEQLGSISGSVVIGDGDGQAELNETPLAAITVTLTYAGPDNIPGTGDDQVITTQTDASGSYTFTNLLPGLYQIVETNPANYISLADADGSNPDSINLNLAVGQDKVNQDFEDEPLPGSITGHLFEDTDGNSIQDAGEPNLANVDVIITDSLGVTQTVTTDANGDYSASVPAGSTTVDVDETTLPAGYVQTAGSDPTTVSVSAGSTTDAGNDGYQPQGTLEGHLFIDTNGDGVQDQNEPDLANVDVIITDSQGVTQTVTTDGDGNYSATVPAGSTIADVDEDSLPSGYVQTAGSDPTTVTVTTGSTTDAGDDGYQPQGTVEGHLFIDTNGDGVQQLSESDLANVDVIITDSQGVTQTVTTDANGDYSATVPAGSTTADVDEDTLPSGYVQTAGSDPSTVTVTAGSTTDAGDDGYQPQGTVEGHLFIDTDGDGTQDAGEPNLANVDVIITDSQGVTQTVTTDSNGDYSATVPAGSTTADVDEDTLPGGYVQTAGSDPTTVSVSAGSTTDAGDDGYQPQGTVEGHLFVDTDGDGIQDVGEPNLANVDVIITDSLGVTQTVTTDSSGDYAATVPAGSTTADVDEDTLPGGYVQTAGSDPTTVSVSAGSTTDAGDDGYQPRTDLAVAKSVDNASPSEGDTIVYTIVATNNGFGNATGVEITDQLPSGTGYIAHSVDQGSYDSGSHLWTVGNLSNGNSATLVITASVDAGSGNQIITNTAQVTGVDQADPNSNNDTAAVTIEVLDPSTATIGDTVWYDANGDGAQDLTEAGFANVTVYLDQNGNGSRDAGEPFDITDADGRYLIGNLPAGTYTVAVDSSTIPAGYSLTTGNDPRPVNLTAGQNFERADFGYTAIAGIEVDKSVSIGTVAPNQEVIYTIVVTNTGPVNMNQVVVTDTLPAGITYVPGSASPVEPLINGQELVWILNPTLAPGDYTQITFRSILAANIGTYTNQAEVTVTFPNGTVTESDTATTVVADPSVEVAKAVAGPGAVNGVITFTIQITNTGPSTLDVLPLFDYFSGPVEYIGGNVPADTVDNTNGVLTWNDLTTTFGDMAPGQVFEIETVFRILVDEASFSMSNQAVVTQAIDNLGNTANDDDNTVILTGEPTAIELLSFTATPQGEQIEVQWVTGAELNTWGFHLWRSEDGSRQSAMQVTPQLIPAQGRGGTGSSYSFTDTNVQPDITYSYWLEETELDGTINQYGPTNALVNTANGSSIRIFLPIIMR